MRGNSPGLRVSPTSAGRKRRAVWSVLARQSSHSNSRSSASLSDLSGDGTISSSCSLRGRCNSADGIIIRLLGQYIEYPRNSHIPPVGGFALGSFQFLKTHEIFSHPAITRRKMKLGLPDAENLGRRPHGESCWAPESRLNLGNIAEIRPFTALNNLV